MSTPYQILEARFARLNALGEAEEVLHWDMSTIMPSGGAEARAEQLAALKAVRHGLMTAPDMPDNLDAAGEDLTLDAWQQANVREMRRRWTHTTALDEDLVTAFSKACSTGEAKWRTARADNDFAAVMPLMQDILNLVREKAAAKADKLGLTPYDALLDEFEPDGRSADIDVLFADLGAFLPGFLSEVMERQAAQPKAKAPTGPFPVAQQRALGHKLMEAIGFDFDHGRLDESLHPFCGGVPDDVRITTRYDEADFTSALMGVLHETGHAMYERGLPKDWRGQPVGESRGMALHESQSLLIEMQVCRSQGFLEFAAPMMRDAFGGDGPDWQTDALYRLYTKVEPGFIRVDADEVTYPAHVILRYRLEQAMIAGDLPLADLPGAWNEAMVELLGITPPDDSLGCLQDIHWYDGAWGYFPTYTLGAMTAAQLFAAATQADATIEPGIEKGDFKPLMGWLRTNVHGKASSASGKDILTEASGRPLDAEVFKAHLKRRYLA